MAPINNEQQLDELLRKADRYLEDQGFTERLVAQLPPALPRWRPWIILFMTFLGALCAFVFVPGGQCLANVVTALATYRFSGPFPWVAASILFLFCATVSFLVFEES